MIQENSAESAKSIQDHLRPFINSWIWFLISVIIAVTIGHIYLRYTPKEYRATGVVLIKDTGSGDGMSELSALNGIGLGNSFNTVENEIEILKSRKLITSVVEKLKLHTEYVLEGKFANTDIYNGSPVLLNIINDSSYQQMSQQQVLKVTPINNSTFSYYDNDLKTRFEGVYGVPLTTSNGLEFFLVPNPILKSIPNSKKSPVETVTIKVSSFQSSVAKFHSRVVATKSERSGSIVTLSISDRVKEKATDIINELISAYNQDAINDANLVAQNTARFIDERLAEVKKDLDSVETGLQSFKTSRNITELVTESALGLEKLSGLEGELIDLQTQKSITNSLMRNVERLGSDFIPENVGVETGDLSSQSAKYNKLLLAYRKQLKFATPENPVVISLKSELDAAKQGVIGTLNQYSNQLEIKLGSLRNEFSNAGGKISTIPLSEKLNRGIERNRSVIESIYLLLSERREVTAISLAITAPKAKIVDEAYAPSSPISPKPNVIYLSAFAIGLLIPFAAIYLKGLLYDKIESRRDLERALPDSSILGEVPKIDKNETDQIVQNDRSILAESFRILRTNLQFKLSTLTPMDRATRVLVTSTVKGEGKTFVSYNLAATLANSGKRVVLVGGDIRNPQIHRYLDAKNKSVSGVTEFLVGKVENIKELAAPISTVPGLDVILSGAIPPNPAELWMQGRTAQLFEQLDSLYDIVLIDSSPTILVTDTLLIKDYADVTVYVTRANYTDKPLLQYINELVKGNKLLNVGLVINDVKSMNLGYGNKYGYTYNADTKTRLERFKAIFSKK